MKPEDQIKALAELDGWTNLKFGVYGSGAPERKPSWHGTPPTRKSGIWGCAAYLTSHNATIPLAVKVCKRRKLRMVCNMGLDGSWECVITANETPNCIPCDGDFYGAGDTLVDAVKEALLRATGKWTT